ncbi:helix-turn-helix domain-containing protein [Streptomyces sp. NPDC055092]
MGLAAARARGEQIGRPLTVTQEQIRHAHGLLTDPENTISSIGRLLGASRTTLYKYVPELAAGRHSLAPNARESLPASR